MSRPARIIVLSLLATCTLAACKPTTTATTDASAGTAAPATTTPTASTPSMLASAAANLNPLASPKDVIKASMDKFLAVRSYHATMEFVGGPIAMGHQEIDFVAPDRFRIQSPRGAQVIIGDTMYMHVRGRSMKVPMPAGTLTQWRDPARLAEAEAGMTVEAQGSDTVDGASASKYHVHHEQPHPSDMTLWINGDDLPVRIRVENMLKDRSMTSTIDYSRFDDPSIKVDPPQ